MRVLIRLLVFLIFLSGLAAVIYFYFPQVWGDFLVPYHYREDFLSAWSDQQGKGCDMPRHLPVAVGFVESGLNPSAVSRAGARGVMQLIPGTGAGLAAKRGITNFTLDSLHDPAVNIHLGTDYLCSLLAASNNDLTMALARYNFGPRAASRDAWPRETHGFVRKVKSVLEAYNALYGPNDEGPARPFVANQPVSFLASISVRNLINVLIFNP